MNGKSLNSRVKDDGFDACCWPDCPNSSGMFDAPLCLHHLRRAQDVANDVAATLRNIRPEAAPPWVSDVRRAFLREQTKPTPGKFDR